MDGIRVTVDMRDVHALAARFPQLLPALEQGTERVVRRAVLEGEHRAKSKVAVDTGHYRRSITSDVQTGPRTVTGRFGSNVPYAPVREFGRRAGARMPPPGVLRGWMRRHGIPFELEFIMRRRIARRGIRGERVLTQTLAELRPVLAREVVGLKGAIIAALRGRP
ncbi:MAG TPA: HK97 gp10 family phage protein [Tepidisphaeraceae bacterium]|jgi:hypothetical protein